MAHRPADSSLAVALTARKWIALLGLAGALTSIAGLLEVTSRARRAEFLSANAMTARAVAGYLTVVAPVDRSGSEFQLIALLSAVHTLADSPRWHRGIQVAWGNAPLLSGALDLTSLDTTTRHLLADSTSSIFVQRSGRTVALVPLLDRDLRNSIGWVAAWGMLAPEGKNPVSLGLLVLVAVAATLALLLPARLLPSRTRWWLVVIAGAGAISLAVQESHRVNALASRRETMVLDRTRQLVERAINMPRIDERQLGRIAPGWHAVIRGKTDTVRTGGLSIPLRSGAAMEISPGPRVPGWSRLQRILAILVIGFVLSVGGGAWARGGGRRENRESSAHSPDKVPEIR